MQVDTATYPVFVLTGFYPILKHELLNDFELSQVHIDNWYFCKILMDCVSLEVVVIEKELAQLQTSLSSSNSGVSSPLFSLSRWSWHCKIFVFESHLWLDEASNHLIVQKKISKKYAIIINLMTSKNNDRIGFVKKAPASPKLSNIKRSRLGFLQLWLFWP